MTKSKKSAPKDQTIRASPVDVKLVRMLTTLTDETHVELIARLLRGRVCKELRARGQDPDRVIAEHEPASRS